MLDGVRAVLFTADTDSLNLMPNTGKCRDLRQHTIWTTRFDTNSILEATLVVRHSDGVNWRGRVGRDPPDVWYLALPGIRFRHQRAVTVK